MAREKKFRAWDEVDKKFRYLDLSDIWQQYTGRKDKNEVEVWEGDMLRDNSGEIYVVGPGGKQRTIKEPISVTNDFLWEEIIGNIYENSDIKL